MGVTEEVDGEKRFNGGMDDEQGHKNDPAVVEENLSIVFRIPDDPKGANQNTFVEFLTITRARIEIYLSNRGYHPSTLTANAGPVLLVNCEVKSMIYLMSCTSQYQDESCSC